MTLERAALAKERVALVQQAEQLKKLSDKLTATVLEALPNMVAACGQGSRMAIEKALAGTAETAVKAAAAAAQPTLEGFEASVSSAAAVQLELRKAVREFQRKWAWFAALTTAGMVLTAAALGYGMVWWQLREVGELAALRDRLTVEVNTLQRQAEQGRRGAASRSAK